VPRLEHGDETAEDARQDDGNDDRDGTPDQPVVPA
jgi:hypothetical protein